MSICVEVLGSTRLFVGFVCWCGPDFVFDGVCADIFFLLLWWSLMCSLGNMNAAFFVVVVLILAFVFVLFWKPLVVGVVFINLLGFVVVRVFCRPTKEQTVRLRTHHGGHGVLNKKELSCNTYFVLNTKVGFLNQIITCGFSF